MAKNLKKGSLQRRMPFNPKDVSESQRTNVNNWQGIGSDNTRNSREAISKDTGNIRNRFLHKLSTQTKTRKHPEGGREFLLHRGADRYSAEPIEQSSTHISHPSNSSWTPEYRVAEGFGNGDPKNINSAWIHENNILTVPKQYGNIATPAATPGHNPFKFEGEVIVGPHTSEKAQYAPRGDTDVIPDINERIQTRGKGHFDKYHQSPEAVLNQRKRGLTNFGKSELTKGANGDHTKESYTFHHKGDKDSNTITAKNHEGKSVGYLDFHHSKVDPSKLYPIEVKVHPEHRRKGLATAMYQFAEHKLGKPFRAGSQSKDAKKLWAQKNRPFGKSELNKASDYFRQSRNENKKNRVHEKAMEDNKGKPTLQHDISKLAEEMFGKKKPAEQPKEPLKKVELLEKPYRSEAQRRWAHTPNGVKALGGKAHVHEWDEATKGKKLPEKLQKSPQLEHYSSQPNLTSISPSKMGSGVDIRTKGRQSSVPHSFYYEKGTAPESVVKDQAKSKYLIDIPPDAKIYDLATDPESHIANLRQQAQNRQVNPGHVSIDDIHQHLKNSGYHGFRNSGHQTLGNVVGLYHDSPVKSEEALGKSEPETISLANSLASAIITCELLNDDLQKSADHGVCTMFLFEGCDLPDVLHCTHQYMGKGLTESDIEKVISVLKDYFKKNPFKPIQKTFDEEEFFGDNKDIRVLRTKSNNGLLLDLRDKLNEMHPDKWPDYKPHVSVSSNVDKIDAPIVNYILCKGGKILWKAVKD